MLMLCSLTLASCKGQQVQTLSPQELAAARTKLAYQQQTQQVSQLKTQGLWTEGPQAQAEQPPTPLPPAQTESTQMLGISTATKALQSEQTQVVSTNTRQPTRPATLATTASSTITQALAAATPTATRTRTPLPVTATATQTQSTQSEWEGVWVGYLQQADGSYRSGPLIVKLNGSQISAVFIAGEIDMSLIGEVLPSNLQANGSYTLPSGEGWFYWVREGDQQFRGTVDNRLAFCAAREGTGQPDPCGYYSPY